MLGMNELPTVRKNRQLEEYNSTSYMSAAFRQSWTEAPLDAIWRDRELRLANVAQGEVRYTYDNPLMGQKVTVTEQQPKKRLSVDEAKAQIEKSGVPLSVPEGSYTQEALDIIIERKKAELLRADQMDRASGIVPGVGKFTAMMAAQILDPVNVASAFVPVVGPARYTAMMAKATTASARALTRAKVGAIEGLAGAAIVEPFVYRATQREQADYDMYDSLLNVGLGSVMGAGLHSGFGAVGDLIKRGYKPKDAVAMAKPSGSMAQRVSAAKPETREAMLRTAISQEVQGKPANIEAIAATDNALTSPYQPGVLSRLKRPEYQDRLSLVSNELKRISKVTGMDEGIDTFREAISKLGGINRAIAESEGIDPAAFKNNRVFRKDGGFSLDAMAENLNQFGYRSEDGSPLTANSLLDIISDEGLIEGFSTSASQTAELGMIRELKAKGYTYAEMERAIEKSLGGLPLGSRQTQIVEDTLLTIGGKRYEESTVSRAKTPQDVKGKSDEEIETELGEILNRQLSDDQFNEIDWWLEQVENEEVELSVAYLRIKEIIDTDESVSLNLNQSLEDAVRNDVKRGSDPEFSKKVDEALSKPEVSIDEELEYISERVDMLEKMSGTKLDDMAEYDQAILKAEEDAKALEAAVLCRLTQ